MLQQGDVLAHTDAGRSPPGNRGEEEGRGDAVDPTPEGRAGSAATKVQGHAVSCAPPRAERSRAKTTGADFTD